MAESGLGKKGSGKKYKPDQKVYLNKQSVQLQNLYQAGKLQLDHENRSDKEHNQLGAEHDHE